MKGNEYHTLQSRLHHAGPLDEAVRQGGLAVVDMGDDAEVADIGHILFGELFKLQLLILPFFPGSVHL